MFFRQGETWHNLRSNLTVGLSSAKVLNAYIPQLEATADEFVDLIRRKRDADGVIMNFKELINLYSMEALSGLVLDKKMGLLEPNPNMEIVELAKAVKQLFLCFRDVFYGSSLWKYLPTKTWTDFVKSEEIIYK